MVPRVICSSALLNVKYEGLSLICFSCGRYGHKKDNCLGNQATMENASSSTMKNLTSKLIPTPRLSLENLLPAETNHFGPWMLVKGPNRARLLRSDTGKGKLLEPKPGKKDSEVFNRCVLKRWRVWEMMRMKPLARHPKLAQTAFMIRRQEVRLCYTEKMAICRMERKIGWCTILLMLPLMMEAMWVRAKQLIKCPSQTLKVVLK